MQVCNYKGFYLQFGMRFEMRFTQAIVTLNLIWFKGSDAAGEFQAQGKFQGQKNFSFVKSYPSHDIHYQGQMQNGVLKGRWRFTGSPPMQGFQIRQRTAQESA